MDGLTPKYLTVDEFIARLGDEAMQLAGRGLRDHREIDRDKLAAALTHADGVIDGYVKARYPRIFAIVPEVLKGAAHDIARYRLRAIGGQQTAMAEAVKDQYGEAMKLLRDIADGRHVLDTDDDGEADNNNGNLMNASQPDARVPRMLDGFR